MVIGVVKDFHVRALYEPMQPVIMTARRDTFYWLACRIRPQNIPETMAFMEAKWRQFIPDRPPNVLSLDEYINGIYQAEVRAQQILTVSIGIALVIACLGLFGLSAFSAAQHTREVGIRKVLGASTPGIVHLLSAV